MVCCQPLFIVVLTPHQVVHFPFAGVVHFPIAANKCANAVSCDLISYRVLLNAARVAVRLLRAGGIVADLGVEIFCHGSLP